MNINEVKTCFKVADVLLNKEHKKNKIKFVYLENLKDETGEDLDKKMLRKRIGFVYLIVINGEIIKIGGSQGKRGDKIHYEFLSRSYARGT